MCSAMARADVAPGKARYVRVRRIGRVDDAANFRTVSPSDPHRDRIDWVGEFLHRVLGPGVP